MTTCLHFDALTWFHLENVVRLNGVQGTLSVVTNQLDCVLRLATLVDDRKSYKEGCSSKASDTMHRDSFFCCQFLGLAMPDRLGSFVWTSPSGCSRQSADPS